VAELLTPFTRAWIARACDRALRRAGVEGVLPTPLDAVLAAAGVRERLPVPDGAGGRVLGALWFEQRAVFVEPRQSAARRRFTEAHEAVHLLCPWHEAALRVDTAAELFGDTPAAIEAEANFGAGRLIFQGERFRAEAAGHDPSLRTAFALAHAYGASRHAAAHHYVETHAGAVALLVAGRWPDARGELPVWRSVESNAFRRRHGRLARRLPAGGLGVSDGAPLAAAIEGARRSSEPVAGALLLPDRGGRPRPFRAEVLNNRHCHLVFVAEAGASAARAAA
jgi:hypothetical protein